MCIFCALCYSIFIIFRNDMFAVHAMRAFANIASERQANIQVSIYYWHSGNSNSISSLYCS